MKVADLIPHRSFWLQEALRKENPSARIMLRGDLRTDVAIIGGGYVGLWTAIQIKTKSPSTAVAILEMDICGGGASGRNGGFALSWWPKVSSLVKLLGRSDGLRVVKDSENAIDEIGEFAQGLGEDIHFRKAGWLWTATSQAQMNAWEPVVKLCESLGAKVFDRLNPQEIVKRSGSNVHRAGVLEFSAATLQPALLAFLLRRRAKALGVQVFENTKVLNFSRVDPLVVRTPAGVVQTKKIVIANNAWAAAIPELSRTIVPITSDMIVTAPAKDLIASTGWTGGEGITDSQTMVDYYQVTQDHRIAFGKGGWGIAYGGHLGSDFDRNPERAQTVEKDFRRYYPRLSSVAVEYDWCGPIDRTPNSLPLLGALKNSPNIFYGVGWSGNGVGPSVIGGKVLSSLVLGLNDEWANYPLIGKSVGSFPPEPIRYIGAHLVRSAVVAKEKAEIEDLAPSWISKKLAGLAPKGLEDKD